MKCMRRVFTLYIQLQSMTFSLVSSKTILPTIHNDNAEFLSVICPIIDIVPGYAHAMYVYLLKQEWFVFELLIILVIYIIEISLHVRI